MFRTIAFEKEERARLYAKDAFVHQCISEMNVRMKRCQRHTLLFRTQRTTRYKSDHSRNLLVYVPRVVCASI